MPSTNGWKRPDYRAMSGDELKDHLDHMAKIGEAYLSLYATGGWPVSTERWQAWWDQTTPEFRVYFPHLPDDTDILVSDMMANVPADGGAPDRKGARQESVHIHPFPGGCVFEQVMVFTEADGSEKRMPGVHLFYLNDEGKVVRSHEYYDLTRLGVAV